MSAVNKKQRKKGWVKKSKGVLPSPNNEHYWVILTEGYKYCLECHQLEINSLEEQNVDISCYFEPKPYEDLSRNLTKRIISIDNTYRFLKSINPKSSKEELMVILKKHLEQQINECDSIDFIKKRSL